MTVAIAALLAYAESNEVFYNPNYEYAIRGFTYSGQAAVLELKGSQTTNFCWGASMFKEGGMPGARTFELAQIQRDRYNKIAAFDAQGNPVPLKPEEIVLDKLPSSYVKHLTEETFEDKLRRVAWWQYDRFGLFVHFGLYALPARNEWFKSSACVSEEKYDSYFRNFNPERFDARVWAKAAKAAGMKYAVLTAKHHDGFCLFDTKYTDYKVTKTPFGRDIVKEYVDAFRAEGLKVGLYYSVIDWHHPDYTLDYTHPRRPEGPDSPVRRARIKAFNHGRDMNRYRTYIKNQIRELLTNYGEISIIWYDFTPKNSEWGMGKTRDDWDSAGILALTRKLQPDIIVDNRLDLDDWEDGQDFLTPEQCRTEEPLTFAGREWPWETCQTFSGSWGYCRDEKTWKSGFQILEQLIKTVSCGGNLIMNVGPTGRGEFDCRAQERLADYGAWMDRCSESIYGCGRAPKEFLKQRIPNTLYTYNPKKNKLYVHFLCWTTGPIPVPFAERVLYVQFLHDKSELTLDDEGRLQIPLDKPPLEIPVVEFTLK